MNLEDLKKKKVIDGRKAEKRFASLFPESKFSTLEEDRYDHWDVEIFYNDVYQKVDVKGLRLKNDKPNEFTSYIELRNVLGKKGWLYGKADLFAFETINYWIIVDKIKLQEFISSTVEKIKVHSIDDLLYKLYTRNGRKDLITMIKVIDLMYLAEKIIIKDESRA